MDLLSYIPYEPSTDLRRAAAEQALPFLRQHLPLRNDGDDGYRYVFDAAPWVNLTRAPSAADRILAFQVLKVLASARPKMGAYTARVAQPWIPDCLRADPALAQATREYLKALHKDARFPGPPDQDIANFEILLRLLYPDIRMFGGYCELYDGLDRDKLVEVGRDLLRRDRLGKLDETVIRGRLGKVYRTGLRLKDLPEPLDRLGLEKGDLLTHLNGAPITGNERLLEMIEDLLEAKATAFTLEWIRDDKDSHARRYVLRRRADEK